MRLRTLPHEQRSNMTDFDTRMDALADRAKEANKRVHDSAGASKKKLESAVSAARASTDKRNQQLKEKASGAHHDASEHWGAAKQNWSDHVTEIRRKADADKSKRDVRHAQHRAEHAERDAADAVAYAIYAIEEAEYEVLDAALARAEADEMAAAGV